MKSRLLKNAGHGSFCLQDSEMALGEELVIRSLFEGSQELRGYRSLTLLPIWLFYTWGLLFVGARLIRAVLFRVNITLPEIHMEAHRRPYMEDRNLNMGHSPLPCQFGGVYIPPKICLIWPYIPFKGALKGTLIS